MSTLANVNVIATKTAGMDKCGTKTRASVSVRVLLHVLLIRSSIMTHAHVHVGMIGNAISCRSSTLIHASANVHGSKHALHQKSSTGTNASVSVPNIHNSAPLDIDMTGVRAAVIVPSQNAARHISSSIETHASVPANNPVLHIRCWTTHTVHASAETSAHLVSDRLMTAPVRG